MTPTRRLAVLILAVALAAGCAGGKAEGPPRLAVHPVQGKLLVADRPASGARLALHPVGGGELRPVGVAGLDGAFSLTTYSAGDGAPEGEYVVIVFWPNDTMPADECEVTDPAAHDRLSGLYADPAKSQLRATVRPGPNAITLHATVGGRGWNLPRLGDPKKDRPVRERDDRR